LYGLIAGLELPGELQRASLTDALSLLLLVLDLNDAAPLGADA
jgi:hypothetical protein